MKKKLLGCALAGLVTMLGTLTLARPAEASAMNGCPDRFWEACGQAPAGCYVSASCSENPDGSPHITCSINC